MIYPLVTMSFCKSMSWIENIHQMRVEWLILKQVGALLRALPK